MQIPDNEILKKYHLSRNDILLSTNSSFEMGHIENKNDETALDIFPNSLFNKKASLSDGSFVGFVMGMRPTEIVIFGDYEQRYEIPKTKSTFVGDQIIINMEWNDFVTYRVDDF